MLVFFSLNVEADHVQFATEALQFFAEQADRQNFRVEATSSWADLNDDNLKQYKLVVWLNGAPPAAATAGLPAVHGERRRMARLPRRGV